MKATSSKPMKAKKGRVTGKALENALRHLGLTLTPKEQEALFHLAELSEVFETIQCCLESVTRSSEGLRGNNRLQIVSQVSQWLTDVQVDLYEHLQPMHLRPLRSSLSSLIDAVCGLEDELEKI